MLDSLYPSVTPGPPRPSRILTPRDLDRQQGRERHTVPGASASLIRLGVGDRLVVINDEGGQVAELVGADHSGRIDPAHLGVAGNCRAEGLEALLATGGFGRLRKALAARGIDLSRPSAIRLFDTATLPRARVEFTAQTDGWLILCAPGLPMAPDAQDSATPITVEMVIQEINRYADSEFRYADKSDEVAIEGMVRDFRRTEEAKKRWVEGKG